MGWAGAGGRAGRAPPHADPGVGLSASSPPPPPPQGAPCRRPPPRGLPQRRRRPQPTMTGPRLALAAALLCSCTSPVADANSWW